MALTNLAPPIPSENDWDHPPQYLSLFTWVKGKWIFRQFLGNAYDLEFHQHRGTYFFQASYREGRFDGEHLSWMYDAETQMLVRTHFEDWGPFYIAGDYLICTRGFERRAHDSSHMIYRYKDRTKGEFVARLHENDSGRFNITFRNPRSGKLETWHFINTWDAPSDFSVTVAETTEEDARKAQPDPPADFSRTAQWTIASDDGNQASEYFQLLTGLNPELLKDKWRDAVPEPATLSPLLIKATGDPEIIARLRENSSQPTEPAAVLERRALVVMEDIVPTPAGMKTIAQVSLQNDRALWGHIFGDEEIGALVAIQTVASKPDQPTPDADLCLLLWRDGWQFTQLVAKVSAEESTYQNQLGWAIKERRVAHTFYVLSSLDPNGYAKRLSWLCDPKTHRLIPTGWRTDFLPSISGDTITFTGQEKPGYSPLIREIHRFDGNVGPLLARITGEDANQRERGQFISVPTSNPDGWETWRIWDRSKEYNFARTIYGLARSEGDAIYGSLLGEATAEFNREASFGGWLATLFLQWRLTGLSTEALVGKWDQDARRNFPKPEWVKVTGDAQAIQRFSWPLPPKSMEADKPTTPVPSQ